MLEIKVTIESPELASAINSLAAALSSKPSTTDYTPEAPSQEAVPLTSTAPVPEITREQIMSAGAALIDAGKMTELLGLLNSYSVQAVTHLKQEQLGAFAAELRKLGAQI